MFLRTLLLGLLMTATSAISAEYFVGPKGNDKNPGTKAEPFKTISHSLEKLKSGDSLLLLSGTYRYSEKARNVKVRGLKGSQDQPITIKAAPGQRPLLDGSKTKGHNLQISNSSHVIVEGLEIAKGPSDGVTIIASDHIVIRNCHIHHNAFGGKETVHIGSGISVRNNTRHCVIERCRIHDNGSGRHWDHGIYFRGDHNVIRNCLIYRNASCGISVHDSARVSCQNLLITNNTVMGLDREFEVGIYLYTHTADTVVQNNIVYRCRYGININPSARKGIVFRNNLSFGNLKMNMGIRGKVPEDAVKWVDNVEADPKLLDAAKFDFRLKQDSPAIDKGIADRSPKKDFAGNARPTGKGVDIGAFEFNAGAAPK